MSDFYKIGKNPLSLLDISKILSEGIKIRLSKTAETAVVKCRKYLDSKMEDTDSIIYGINNYAVYII